MAEKILIVDDDLDTLRLVGLMLQRQGYQISAATNGQQGLEKAFEEDPDLILLDVMMPGLTGWEVTKYVRQREGYDDTLILMLTAVGEGVNAMTAPLYGADRYLDKPFDTEELAQTVSELLKQGRSQESRR